MQLTSLRKWLLALTLLAVILWTIVHFYNQNAQRTANAARIILEPQGDFAYHEPKSTAAKTNHQSQVDAAAAQKFLRQKVEEWLALHHHSAASLLAAFHVLDDTNYLREAATNFPDNPQVEWTILVRNAFPENRRKWLDLFKASSPSNSLANYLSAQSYFHTGHPAAAVKDLVAATSKPDFANYGLASQLNAEELSLFLGMSAFDASETAFAGWSADTTGELATLKRLAGEMENLQTQELNVGDHNSAENLAAMGTVLGDQLTSGTSGNYIVNQLAGLAIEEKMLTQLDPNATHDFLGGESPAQRLQEIKQQETALNQLVNSYEAIRPNLTDAEKVIYRQRVNIYGEVTAMRWLLQQQGSSQSGQ